MLIAIGTAMVVTFLANRTRFGRYVFAIGGNPEAADLSGINTRWIVMKIFILMGVLCGVAGAVASARLNAATNSLGTLDELYTIAAAVIGGTSFTGGIGTVPGAMLGALVMQSLAIGHAAHGHRVAIAEYRLRAGAGGGGRYRHRLPQAHGVRKVAAHGR